MSAEKRIAEAIKRLTQEGYELLEPARYRNPWNSSPVLCAMLRSPQGREEIATFSTLDHGNPILGIYPRSLTEL